MRFFVLLLCLAALAPGAAWAGDGWSAKQISTFEGTERRDEARMFFEGGRLRIDAEQRSYIITLGSGTFVFLDHSAKTFAKADLEEIVAFQKSIIDQMKAQIPRLPEQLQAEARARIAKLEAQSQRGDKPKIHRTGKKEKLGGYTCEIVTWKDDLATNEACIAEKLPVNVKPFLRQSSKLADRLAKMGASNAAPTQALFHLPGLPVRTKRTRGDVVSVTRIEQIEPFQAKPETFVAPKTYQRKPLRELVAPGL